NAVERPKRNQESAVRKWFVVAISGLAFLTGCGDQGKTPTTVSADTKWKGAPYRLALDAKQQKPNPSGVTIPAIDYTANPEALERRANLVVRLDTSALKQDQPAINQMIMAPTEVSGTTGALSSDYIDSANKGLAQLLTTNCMKGKVKITVALVRSSISPNA